MIVYLKEQKTAFAIDSREVAPIASTQDMFVGKPGKSLLGGLASGIPGEIAGYWLAHQKAGRLPWKRLFKPSIDLCRNGIPVSPVLAFLLERQETLIRRNEALSKVFIEPKANRTYKNKESIINLNLANTLEIISEKGAEAFYKGELASQIVEENNLNSKPRRSFTSEKKVY